MATNNPGLSEQDIHLALAAIRFMQANLPQLPTDISDLATNGGEFPLPDTERLESLCEWLNLDMPAIPDHE